MSNESIAKNKIEVEIDDAGVSSGIAKIEKSIKTLGKSAENAGKEASKGIEGIAGGGDKAAASVERNTKSIIASIQRQIAVSQAGARGTAEYYEAIAGLKGANLSALRPYIEQLKQTQVESKKLVTETSAIKTSLAGVATAALSVGAGFLALRAVSGAITSSIDSLAALDDAAQKTGSSVENLSRIQQTAVAFGEDFGGNIEPAITKLARGIAGLDDPSNKANAALKALGINARDNAGQLRDASQITIEVAKALQGYQDGAAKAALVTDLFGKSGAELLPFLNDMAENVDKFSGASAQSASQAAALQDQMNGLKQKAGLLAQNFTIAVIPAFDQIISKINETARTGGILKGVFAGIGETIKVAFVGSNYENAKLRSNFGIPAEIAKLTEKLKNDAIGYQKLTDSQRERVASDLKKLADEMNGLKKDIDAFEGRGSPAKTSEPAKKALAYTSGADAKQATERESALKRLESAYQSVTDKSKDYLQSVRLETAEGEKLTQGQKLVLELRNFLAENTVKLNAVQKQNIGNLIEQVNIEEKYADALAYRAERASIAAQAAIALNEQDMQNRAGLAAALSSIESLTSAERSRAESLQEQIDAIKLGEVATAQLKEARLLEAAAAFEQNAAYAEQNGVAKENIESMRDRAKALRELAQAQVDTATKNVELERIRAAQQKAEEAAKQIQQSLTDAIFRGFESGKNFAQNFRQSLINTFKTLVLRPLISFIVDSSGITKLLGSLGGLSLSSTAAAAESGGGLTGLLSKGGTSLFDLISKGNGSIVSSIESLGASIANGQGGLLDSIGGFLGGNASSIADGLGYTGAIVSALKGDFKSAALIGAGTAIGGPIGGAIGGIVGGLFGKSKAKRNYSNVSTQTQNGDFSVLESSARRKGGQFLDPQINLASAFSSRLGEFFSAFDLGKSISTNSSFSTKSGGKTRANFSSTIDGNEVNSGGLVYGKKDKDAFSKFIQTVMTDVTVKAIQSSSLGAGIKSLFDGVTSSDEITKRMQAVMTAQAAQRDLTNAFNLTTDAAARVARTQGDVIASLNAITQASIAMRTAGENVIFNKDSLKKLTGFDVLPASLKDFDNILKSIDVSASGGAERFAKLFNVRALFAQTIDQESGIKAAVKNSIFDLLSPSDQQLQNQQDLAEAFGKFNLAVPSSVEELLSLAKSIDYTTVKGLDLAAAFPSLVDQFTKTKEGVDALTSELNANYFSTFADFKSAQAAINGGQSPMEFIKGQVSQNKTLLDEILRMRQENADLKAIMLMVSEYTAKQERVLDDWDVNGMPAVRAA